MLSVYFQNSSEVKGTWFVTWYRLVRVFLCNLLSKSWGEPYVDSCSPASLYRITGGSSASCLNWWFSLGSLLPCSLFLILFQNFSQMSLFEQSFLIHGSLQALDWYSRKFLPFLQESRAVFDHRSRSWPSECSFLLGEWLKEVNHLLDLSSSWLSIHHDGYFQLSSRVCTEDSVWDSSPYGQVFWCSSIWLTPSVPNCGHTWMECNPVWSGKRMSRKVGEGYSLCTRGMTRFGKSSSLRELHGRISLI